MKSSTQSIAHELAELERIYRTAPVGLCFLDTELRFVRINERLAAMNVKPVSEHIGRSIQEMAPRVAPKLVPMLREILRTGEPVLELEDHAPLESEPAVEREWLCSYLPIKSEDGRVQGITSVVQDVTALKRAEQESRTLRDYLDSILLNLPVGLAILEGPDFRYFRINEWLAGLNGLPVAAHLGKTVVEVLPDVPGIVANLRTVRSRGEATLNREFTARLPSDPDRELHLMDFHFPIEVEGEVRAVGAVVLDITARKQAEEATREAYETVERKVQERTKELAEVNAALVAEVEETARLREAIAHVTRASTMGELAASLAHELNQPLTAIVTNAATGRRLLSREGGNRDELPDIFSDIAADGFRAGEIIRHLRGLLKKGSRERLALDMTEVIREVIPLIRSDAVGKGVSLRSDLAAELPSILGDRIQLQQVVLNFIINGFDAMSDVAGERALTVEASRGADGRHVQITVSDTGTGLDADLIDQVFEPYYTTKPQGMGMGLTINRSIVEAHGGRIWATANPDRGVTFAFTLPIPPTGPDQVDAASGELGG